MASGLLVVRAGRAVASVGAAFLRNSPSWPLTQQKVNIGRVVAPLFAKCARANQVPRFHCPNSLQARFFSLKQPIGGPIIDSRVFQFPDRLTISRYLREHPTINDQHLDDMIPFVATHFSHKKWDEFDVMLGAMLCLCHLSLVEKLDLPEEALWMIHSSFVTALKDCANGKKIN